ncbi:MAG: HlyD family efflux transporter periplasmic adaptor subunit [Bacteroidetes bacterium]|nr:MAG: HlyD family efflux transporter periplasmic adaptor subunit [Bacteroidota bacterium]
MLNISKNSVKGAFDIESYSSFSKLSKPKKNVLLRLIATTLLIGIVIMFLPWTQNIRAEGYVTALQPNQRPQTIHSIIPGRIEKWFVNEGDQVEKGDTIVFISEVKEEYLDPELLQKTEQQVKAKELTVSSYMEKVKALDSQVDALLNNKKLKIQQAQNKLKQALLKVQSDSIALKAAETDYTIALKQLERIEGLYKDGIKSLTDVEQKRLKVQETLSKKIGEENKLLTSKNEVLNAEMEMESIDAEYNDKIAKSKSEKFTALSSMYDAEAIVTKLQNQYMNYSIRSGMYYITAPQNGYITKAIKSGIGETIKEGTEIVSIMPSDYQLAVNMYVEPIDLPLINKGEPVRIQFDGWPAIVFSGWPNASYGTFTGKVVAIDNFISPNGMYRVLVAPDENEYKWPEEVKVGAGAKTITLLNDVPIWFELWRKLNGFPPNFYSNVEQKQTKEVK